MCNLDHLYILVPFCSGKCAYCSFYSEHLSEEAGAVFLKSLRREAELRLEGTPPPRPSTIYIGGGTPSLLSPAQLRELVDVLESSLSLEGVREWTIEANPGTWSAEKLEILREAGVTRISLGVQALCDETLSLLGRRHAVCDVEPTIRLIREAGIGDVGIDLIAALPGVAPEAWRHTLAQAIDLGVEHISVYALTLEPGTDLYRRSELGEITIPDEAAQLEALFTAWEVLEAGGYRRYEISNYARPGHESIHNLAYWRGRDYLGLGPAASSRVGLERWTIRPSLDAYAEALSGDRLPPGDAETLTAAVDAAERLAFGFRLAEGVDMREHSAADDAQRDRWQAALDALQAEGLITRGDDGRWYLSRRGWDMADAIAEAVVE